MDTLPARSDTLRITDPECALVTRTSSYSNDPTIGACVKVGPVGGGIGIADSKDPKSPVQVYDRASFGELLRAVRNGLLDL